VEQNRTENQQTLINKNPNVLTPCLGASINVQKMCKAKSITTYKEKEKQ
jgi:hypothetical protein